MTVPGGSDPTSAIYVANSSLTGSQLTNAYSIVLAVGNTGNIPMTGLAVTITPPSSLDTGPVSKCIFSPLLSSS